MYPQNFGNNGYINTTQNYVSYYKGVEHNYTKLIDNELYDRVLYIALSFMIAELGS